MVPVLREEMFQSYGKRCFEKYSKHLFRHYNPNPNPGLIYPYHTTVIINFFSKKSGVYLFLCEKMIDHATEEKNQAFFLFVLKN